MKFYKTDWFMRVASLIAAIAIWFYVVYQENPMYTRWITNIPLDHQNISGDFENGKLIINSISAEDIDVKINGRRRLVAGVNSSSAQAYVDMSGVTDAGEYNLPVKVDFTIDGADVVQIKPNYCTVSVDRVVTEEREIAVKTAGAVKEGYIMDDITINPAVIKLTGPQKLINSVADCEISVNLADASSDIKGLYKIKLHDERGQEIEDSSITKNIEYTDVYCSVAVAKTVKLTPSLSSDVNAYNQKITAVCTPSAIKIKGKTAALDDISEIFTEIVDISEITDSAELEQDIILPDGVFFADENTKSVKIKITAEKLSETTDE